MSDDDRINVIHSDEIDTEAIEGIRDAHYRLSSRVYAPDDQVKVYVGDSIWRRLQGDYVDIKDKPMSIDGRPVVHYPGLPEDRAMLVAESALREIEYDAVPREQMGLVFEEEPAPTPDPQDFETVTATGQILDRVEAIEFVPEFEVNSDV